MGKASKYKFNKETLSYDKVVLSFKNKILKLLSFVSTGLVFSVIILILVWNFIDSPKEKRLKREIEMLTYQYDVLMKRLQTIDNILNEIQDRDDNIYRVVFESDPIPSSIRKAGFGGGNRYNKLMGYNNSDLIIETTKKLDQLKKQIAIQSKSYDEVFQMAMNKANMIASIPAIQPVSNKDLRRLASGFGYRIHPMYKTLKLHTGIDFTAPIGTPIYATGNGTIQGIEYSRRGYGNNILINHGYGYKTLYAHVSVITAKNGQKIKRGEIIGYVGNSGTSTAPHLHYEVIKNNRKIDPINYFYNDLTPEEYEKMIDISSRATQTFD